MSQFGELRKVGPSKRTPRQLESNTSEGRINSRYLPQSSMVAGVFASRILRKDSAPIIAAREGYHVEFRGLTTPPDATSFAQKSAGTFSFLTCRHASPCPS